MKGPGNKSERVNKQTDPPSITLEEKKRRMNLLAMLPEVNSSAVIGGYQDNLIGDCADGKVLANSLRETFQQVTDGDLIHLEHMLIGQAKALETIFTSLAKRAASQNNESYFQTFLGLALKAQAQSRATISALVELKYPKQATFVKQANIANGPQQVNNSATVDDSKARTLSHERKSPTKQNELLERAQHGCAQLDTGAKAKATRGHSKVEAVGAINRTAKPRR